LPVRGWDGQTQRLDWAPQAIVCSITGFGLTGPHAWWESTPFVSFAMSGRMDRVGSPEGPPLAMPGRHFWDNAGIYAATSILAALGVRESVGPQMIDLSVHEVAAWKDWLVEQYEILGMSRLVRQGAGYVVPPTGTFQCQDGPFEIAAFQPWHWDAFCEMLDRPEELADPRLVDVMVRRERFEELRAIVQDLVANRSRQDLLERGQAAGLPCGVLNRPTQFVADPQTVARKALIPTPSPSGLLQMPVPGSGYFTTPDMTVSRTSAPPLPGADTVWWEPRPPRSVLRTGQTTEMPLDGVRVLSFGAFIAGNTVAALLGQLGADVVKIEARSRPEVTRSRFMAIGEIATEPSGVTNTVMYATISRSVRNLSLDIKTPAGRDLFHRLVRAADVVIENLGSGSVARWGLTFDDLRALNPKIVVTSLSGYGRTGPRGPYLAYAPNISSFVGMTSAWGHSAGGQSDYVAGEHAAFGTLAALRVVKETGRGVWVDAAQIEAMAAIMPDILLEAAINGRDIEPSVNEIPGALLSGAYRCTGHDAWIAVEIQDLSDWDNLCRLVDLPVGVASSEEARKLRPVAEAALQGWAEERTALSAARELQKAGIAAGVVQKIEDLWRDPQLWSRDFLVPVSHPDLGTYYYGDSPFRLSATPGRIGNVGGRLGQDTTAILAEWIGITETELEELLADGAIFQG
jgi:crotonobetainyl-CoA:carnitine CoA-transferase CaiB-like acyl-CoA transferase